MCGPKQEKMLSPGSQKQTKTTANQLDGINLEVNPLLVSVRCSNFSDHRKKTKSRRWHFPLESGFLMQIHSVVTTGVKVIDIPTTLLTLILIENLYYPSDSRLSHSSDWSSVNSAVNCEWRARRESCLTGKQSSSLLFLIRVVNPAETLIVKRGPLKPSSHPSFVSMIERRADFNHFSSWSFSNLITSYLRGFSCRHPQSTMISWVNVEIPPVFLSLPSFSLQKWPISLKKAIFLRSRGGRIVPVKLLYDRDLFVFICQEKTGV